MFTPQHVSCVTCHLSPVTCHMTIFFFDFLADPGKARGCSTNSLAINSFSKSVSLSPHSFTAPPQTIRDSISSHKIDYVIVIKNPEGHQNLISDSKVTAILLKGWIVPFGGASSGRVCACSLHSRLVFIKRIFFYPTNKMDKVVKQVGGGSVINGAYPV